MSTSDHSCRSAPELILASQSPRRHALLAEHGYRFTCLPPAEEAETNGAAPAGERPEELVLRLACQKADDVLARLAADESRVVLACDTVAECGGEVLGKPRDLEHAREMLRRLRGREHRVLSGVCLHRPRDARRVTGVEVTRLVMDTVSDLELETYLATGGWEGKAGAFGFQDGLDWIQIVAGSESNVVGLPMERLAEWLSAFGDAPAP